MRRGKVLCLNLDNNELLGLFAARGIRLSALVIIRDGCAEGGNYECAARVSFFSRVMPLMTDEFAYFTDHGYPPRRAPAVFTETAVPIHIGPFVFSSAPLAPMRAFRVTAPEPERRDFTLGRIQVTVARESIWGAVDRSDYMVVTGSPGIPRYIRGRFGNPVPDFNVDVVDRNMSVTSIEKYLRMCNERKLSRISFMPLANGAYEGILREIEEWTGEFPRQISFYHLHAEDYWRIRSVRAE